MLINNYVILRSVLQFAKYKLTMNIYLTVMTVLLFIEVHLLSFHHSYSDDNNYHNHKDLQAAVRTLTLNPIFKQKTCDNTKLYNFIEIGHEDAPLNAIIMCNIHARQIISAQICLKWLQELTSHSNITQHYFIRIFIEGNSNREAFIQDEKGCLRKNQNAIDLNRNFPTDFNHYNSSKDNQSYGGQSPITQPLTICLNTLIQQQKPDVYIDIHSGMNKYAFYQQGVNNEKQIYILETINEDLMNGTMTLTTLAKEGEPINGHIFADLKVRLNVPYSVIFQTYATTSNNCFLQFNPLKQEKQQLTTLYSKIMDEYLQKIADIQLTKQQNKNKCKQN